jgi:hypothetical protein
MESPLIRTGAATGALLVHTLGYLLVTGTIAFVVYEKLGLEVLRKAWVNLDLIWAVALISSPLIFRQGSSACS